jgi:hypothetical protein
MGHQWTRAAARAASAKGVAARRAKTGPRTPDWRKGYEAGWKACERFYRSLLRRSAVA